MTSNMTTGTERATVVIIDSLTDDNGLYSVVKCVVIARGMKANRGRCAVCTAASFERSSKFGLVLVLSD